MAYRKKTTRRRSVRRAAPARRRRMGAVGRKRGQNFTKLLGGIAGVVIPNMLSGMTVGGTVLDGKIVGAGSAAIGFFLPQFVKGDFAEGASIGMMGAGGALLLKEFGVLNGIPIIAGWQDLKAINGTGAAIGVAQSVKDAVQSQEFKPSFSQVMNGIYNRGYAD